LPAWRLPAASRTRGTPAALLALLGLAGCAASAAVSGDWRDLGAAERSLRVRDRLHTDFRLIKVPGAVVRFIDVGPAAGTPVLFVHGLEGGLGDFAPVMLRMAGSVRLMAADLPGSGGSASMLGDYSVSGQARVLAAFIDAVAPGPVHLVCHSLGGQICLALALHRADRVRSLTLVSPAGVYRSQQYLRATARHFGGVNIGTIAIGEPSRTLVAALTYADGQLLQRFVTRNPATLSMLASFRENLREHLQKVRVPTLAIWGDADPVLPMADGFVIAANVPGAVLHVVEGAGHEPQLTHEEVVHEWIEAFLRQH
jgi:pimeloyl-ACP methyl ester carboxylesterase